MKYPTYLVGGAVRDNLLDRPFKDRDYVMCAPSFEAMEAELKEQGATIFVSKPEFLTIRCKHPTLGVVDFACGRCDGDYTDGRRPDSTNITTDIVADLARRDFTINAMAENVVTGELFDPFYGADHLANGVIQCVGNPKHRFNEDKLRIIRAVRFAVVLNFRISDYTIDAINSYCVDDFVNVSTDRIREELFKMFRCDSEHSLYILNNFPIITRLMHERGIWLMPTTAQA